jgi:hypothetical protein
MYTSYAAPTFSYGESIKNRRAEQNGKEYLLVGVGQAGERVTPDQPETSLNRGFSPMVYSYGIRPGIQQGVSYEYSEEAL